MAAVGRHHKRGDAAFDRATSFVVSFMLVMRVDVVQRLVELLLLGIQLRRQPFFNHSHGIQFGSIGSENILIVIKSTVTKEAAFDKHMLRSYGI